MNTTLKPFEFKSDAGVIRLREACWIDERLYFTDLAIGVWLEYWEADRAIQRIVERNPHIRPFENVVESTTTIREPPYFSPIDIRVYDPIGLQLIMFESRQPKAIEYKVAVAHLVEAYATGELRPPRRKHELWNRRTNWRRYGHPSKRVARQRREARPETIARDPVDELVVQALRLAILARRD